MAGFGQVKALKMLQHLFTSYMAIDEIDFERNAVKMIRLYNPIESLAHLIDQLEEEREFPGSGGQTIADTMMVLKGVTPLAQTAPLNEDIREWRQKYAELKTWAVFKKVFHQAHREQRRAVTTSVKGGYTMEVQNVYSILPLPL